MFDSWYRFAFRYRYHISLLTTSCNDMALTNGRVMMRDSVTSSTYSPKSFSPTSGIPQSVTSSTLDNASLDELDRIMDTLSTLSRGASKARAVNRDDKKHTLSSPPESEETNLRLYPDINQTSTSFTSKIQTPVYPPPAPISMPPPTTSPPQTPMQHQRNFTANPKIMTLAALPAHQTAMYLTRSDARNPATIPRLPVNPYENTSLLHGSHVNVRPSRLGSNDHTNPFPLVPDSPYVNKHPSISDESGQHFFGHIPEPTIRESPIGSQHPTQQPQNFVPSSVKRNDHHNMRPQREFISLHRPNHVHQESHTLPAYNEKRSYLKNLEEGTLPRPKIDSVQQLNSHDVTPTTIRKHKQKPSMTEDVGEALNRLSLKRSSKRRTGKSGVYNASKPSSRHSTTSFNSYDLGRGYASVSTAPASTRGLIQHEVLPHGRKKRMPSPLANSKSPDSSNEDENCCVKYGRFLYSHILELLILVAFCAGLPAGIVIQATQFHRTELFQKYYAFWGSIMLPRVLSTITPLLVVSSILSGVGNLTVKVLRRLSVLLILYFTATTVAAIGIAIMFSYVLNPGSHVLSSENSTNVTRTSGGVILAIADKGESLDIYRTQYVQDTVVTDEILRFIQMLFPGCGSPIIDDYGEFCNLFVLALFAGVIGIGASMMNLEGGPVRHVFSQIGAVMSNMADILLWYVPFGVFFIVSELVATKLNWTHVGFDSQLDKMNPANATQPSPNVDVTTLDAATKRFILTVICSIAVYSLVFMPVIACLLTISRPCSGISFRTTAPLVTSFTTGFSDLCMPLTLRSLLKTKGTSRCCKPKEDIDRRIVRTSVVLGGIFHRAGTAILLTCSAIFLSQIEGKHLSTGAVVIIGASSMITSITSPTGRWFHQFNPYMRAIVINLSTAGLTAPREIPGKLLCFWAMCRVAAFADTFVDTIGAHILYHHCKSKMRDIQDGNVVRQDEESTDSSNVDSKTSPTYKSNPPRSTSGETSDYEEAPLIFSRSTEAGNESSSMNSRNDDVFLPNRSQEPRPAQPQQDFRRTNNHPVQTAHHGEVSFVTF